VMIDEHVLSFDEQLKNPYVGQHINREDTTH
jgi:hypothetical protein